MEIADIVWISFDALGNLNDATPTQIDAIVNNRLGNLCTITEISNTNNVHRYNVKYTIAGEPLPVDKII